MTFSTRSASLLPPHSGSFEPREVPGLMVVFERGRATLYPLPFADGELVLGRTGTHGKLDDEAVSRRHTRVRYDGRVWSVEDLGSRNGTFVDGARIDKIELSSPPRSIRVGGVVLIASNNVLAHDAEKLRSSDAPVVGASLMKTWARIEKLAQSTRVLHLVGESGVGKELAARRFHDSAAKNPEKEPYVVVNCATIPPQVAERVLFGTKRGAYTGANADAPGLLQSAHNGTIFLDEVAELDLAVQAKLLRVVETGEILPLGATKSTRVDLRICSATHADLQAAVDAGTFRADLRYRIGAPTVEIPPLRDRLDEIPWHIQHELTAEAQSIKPHASLIEACLCRPWHGNVRELRGTIRSAAVEAGLRESPDVRARDLEGVEPTAPGIEEGSARLDDRDWVHAALREHGWNVSGCAKAIGVHRNQLRRAVTKHAIEIPTSDG